MSFFLYQFTMKKHEMHLAVHFDDLYPFKLTLNSLDR
jgi:hypothetical protein